MNMLKIRLLFKIYKLHEQITREFLVLRMRNFQGIVFIWPQRYREIFKSALVYLEEVLGILNVPMKGHKKRSNWKAKFKYINLAPTQ